MSDAAVQPGWLWELLSLSIEREIVEEAGITIAARKAG